MAISASDVKALREKTGAGMMECKKALTEAGGDVRKAEKILKELGLAAAAKRSGRATNEGRIFSKTTGTAAGILELSCETDFVARNEEFVEFGENLLRGIIDNNVQEVNDELLGEVTAMVSKLKENITLRRFFSTTLEPNQRAVDYIHGEGRIGVLVVFSADTAELYDKEEVKNFMFDTALHVAAFNPKYLSPDTVEEPYLKEQQEIFLAQAKNLGKPEKVIEGIVKGKLNKHLSEICLLNQGFVKDDKQSVAKVMQQVAKDAGGKLDIVDFTYYAVGEEL